MNRHSHICTIFTLFFETARLGDLAEMRNVGLIQGMVSGPRRMSRAIKRARTVTLGEKLDHVIKANAGCKLDTRADIICAGKNFRLLLTTGGVCDVKGFYGDFDAIKDIPIARVATAFQDKYCAIYILIINEALYFGPSMDHSLIIPNQIRHHGIPISDNNYYSNRDLRIDHSDVFIPFLTQGSTVFFNTHVLSDNELKAYLHIAFTSGELEWDPMESK